MLLRDTGTGLILALLLAAPATARQTPLPAQDRIMEGTPAALFTIGKEEGADWELLAGVRAVTFDAQGNLYILDGDNQRVIEVGPDGQLARVIGHKGGGPGEFQFPLALTILPDGSLVVFDAARRGYSRFDAAGQYQGNGFLPEGVGLPSFNGVRAAPDGQLVVAAGPALSQERPGADSIYAPIFRQPLSGDKPSMTTLFRNPLPAPRVQDTGSSGGRRVRMVSFSAPTFSPQLSWGVLPDGDIAVSNGTDYAIRIIDPAGKVVRTFRRPFTARAVTRQDEERARSELRKRLKEGGGGLRIVSRGRSGGASFSASGAGAGMTSAQIEERVNGMQFATVMPVIQRIFTDPAGHIWVQRTGAEGQADGPIDLLTGTGRYIGTLQGATLPDAVSADGRAAYIEKDDMGVEHVVVKRLPNTWK